MKVLYDEAQFLYHQFDHAKIEHNLRHKNELADKLVNLALDRKMDVTDPEGNSSPLDAPTPTSTARLTTITTHRPTAKRDTRMLAPFIGL